VVFDLDGRPRSPSPSALPAIKGRSRGRSGAASCGFSRPASRPRRRCPCARPSGPRGSRPGAV